MIRAHVSIAIRRTTVHWIVVPRAAAQLKLPAPSSVSQLAKKTDYIYFISRKAKFEKIFDPPAAERVKEKSAEVKGQECKE